MNRVETGFSSYRRSGGTPLQFTTSKPGTRHCLIVLGVIVLMVCAFAGGVDSSEETAHMSTEVLPPVAMASGPDTGESTTREHVTLLQVSAIEKDGRTTVEISLSGRASHKSFILSDPLRLVLDIEGAILRSRPDPIAVDDGVIDQIRLGQFNPSVVRVVFDLARTTSYTVIQTDDRPDVITVAFPKRVTGVEFFNRDGRGEAVICGAGSLQYEASSLSAPPRIVVDLPGTVLVSDAINVPVSHPQATQIRASQFTPDTVRVVVDLVEATTYSVFTTSDRPGEVIIDFGYRILGVEYTSDQKSTVVNVISTGNTEVKSMVLTAPHRIVLDFENSTLDTTERVVPVEDSVVRRIRLAQHSPMTVRVVLDLDCYVGHSTRDDKSGRGVEVAVFKSPVSERLIVIDPGHGGVDPGAIGPTGLKEKDVVLDISKRVAKQLEAMGAQVVLTRSEDVAVSLPDRVNTASNVHADAFISIHANASRSGGPTGTETLYAGAISMSRVLAEYVQAALVSEIGQFNRGARERNDLMVIRESKCPACLVEVVFMSNLAEELLLLDPGFRQKAAQGIANGIASYFQWRKDGKLPVPAGDDDRSDGKTDDESLPEDVTTQRDVPDEPEGNAATYPRDSAQPEAQPDEQPETDLHEPSEAQLHEQPAHTDQSPETQDAQPEAQSGTQPEAQLGTQPETQSGVQPETQLDGNLKALPNGESWDPAIFPVE